jgi:lipopolysaccharide/colanic/teichoic acid biosynthesis glycosyltransferase
MPFASKAAIIGLVNSLSLELSNRGIRVNAISPGVVGPRPVMEVSFEAYPDNVKETIYDVKPGLTGVGSIIFRDEEELITNVKNKGGDIVSFYKNEIYPHKGKLELWYQNNKSLFLDFKIILVTACVIFNPKSRVYEKLFKDLPLRNF